jgi:hypothetical protein
MKCNSSKGLLKRFIPFFLTFAVGLLIASFFIPITAPDFSGIGRKKRAHRAEDEQIRLEIQQLREENLNLKMELRSVRDGSFDWSRSEDVHFGEHPLAIDAPPPPPPAPKAPSAPRK